MTKFIENFNSRIELKNFDKWIEEELYSIYQNDENENKYRLITKFFEYKDNDQKIRRYILFFIKILWEKNRFYNEDINNALKSIIEQYVNYDSNLDNFLIIFKSLVKINKNDDKYYKNLFDKIIAKWFYNKSILNTFLDIFIEQKQNTYFLKSTILILKDQSLFIYGMKIWKYFKSLSEKDFRIYFLKLLQHFSDEKEKDYLRKHYKYSGIIDFEEKINNNYYEYEMENKRVIDDLLLKIEKINFTKKELDIVRNFIFSDLNYIIKKFNDIEKNYFDKNLFSILEKRTDNLLYDYLNQAEIEKIYIHNTEFVWNHLNVKNIDNCLSIYKDKEWYFFRVYLYIRKKKKYNLINIIKKNQIFYKNLIDIEKDTKKEQKKWEMEEKKRISERKKWILTMTDVESWYYPKLLQDYYELIDNKEDFDKFTNKEKNKLNNAVQKQAISCLNALYINNYDDDKIRNIVTFEENWEWSTSITWTVYYLQRILHISKYLKFDIVKYYKNFVLAYPLLFWDEVHEDFLWFMDWKITKSDIDYILKVYSEDLHEKAIWLRFYSPDWLYRFYNKFHKLFDEDQTNKLKSILLDFIKSDKIRYNKDEFIEQYSQLVDEKTFIKIYKEPNINYFKSIISNKVPVSEPKQLEFKKQLKINELLITKFEDKNALLRRIKQLKDWIVEFKSPNYLKNGEFDGKLHPVSLLEDELEFIRDNDRSFSYFLKRKSSIDIKDEMLEILELWLQIDQEIKNWLKSSDYKAYSTYLINLFYWYVWNLENKKRYWQTTMKLIKKYPDNDLNISLLWKYFWIKEKDYIWQKSDPIYKYKKRIVHLENQNKTYCDENIALKKDNSKLRNILWVTDPKCILFVEWLTDKTILETAYEKICWYNDKFVIRSAWWAIELCELMKDLSLNKQEFENVIIIWLVDFDREWYSRFNRLWKLFIEEEEEKKRKSFTWLFKQDKENKNYVMSLPIPKDKKSLASLKMWKKSMLTIENLFHSKVFDMFFSPNTDLSLKGDKDKWIDFHVVWNDKIWSTVDPWEKIQFSKFISTLDKEYFSEFESLFNKIKEIIDWK